MEKLENIKTEKTYTYISRDGKAFPTEHACKLYEAKEVFDGYIQKLVFLDNTYETFKCNNKEDWDLILYHLRFSYGRGFSEYVDKFEKYKNIQIIIEYDSGDDWDICRLSTVKSFIKNIEETIAETQESLDKLKFFDSLPPLVPSIEW